MQLRWPKRQRRGNAKQPRRGRMLQLLVGRKSEGEGEGGTEAQAAQAEEQAAQAAAQAAAAAAVAEAVAEAAAEGLLVFITTERRT